TYYPRTVLVKMEEVYQLVKEKLMYEKEAKQQEEKVEKMRAEDGENYAIKKQENEKDLEESEEYKEARSVLDSVKLEA
uniref:Tubulin-specific chaperone A n=1 Tax=Vombatus ursinus TaxID=29139 RepID=A0A4X2LTJ6_VOMUR